MLHIVIYDCRAFIRLTNRGAATAHLHFPSCCPGFESQAHHQCFYQFKFELCHANNTKINEKDAGIGPFKKRLTMKAS